MKPMDIGNEVREIGNEQIKDNWAQGTPCSTPYFIDIVSPVGVLTCMVNWL